MPRLYALTFHQPTSSPHRIRMLGLRPPVATGAGWACAILTSWFVPRAEAAASVLPPRRMLRRLITPFFVVVSDLVLSRSFVLMTCSSHNAAKADMARGRVDRLSMARRRTVATAIVWRTQMRAAFEHLAWNSDVGLARVVARCLGSTAWIFRNAARLRRVSLVLLRIPVGRPFPDVADHVVETVAVGRESHHRRGALVTILIEVLPREFALPGIRCVLAARRELVTPGKLSLVKSSARRKFPFGFSRQLLAGPFRVSLGIAISDMHDRMIVKTADGAARSIWPPPVGAELEIPPSTPVAHVHRMVGRGEHQRARLEHVRQRAGIILCVWLDLGEGDVTGSIDELAKVAVRHRRAVDPERIDRDAMNGRFFGIVFVGAHAERAAGYCNHVVERDGETCKRRCAIHRRFTQGTGVYESVPCALLHRNDSPNFVT